MYKQNRSLALFAVVFVLLALPASAHDVLLSGIKIVCGRDQTNIAVSTHISRLLRAEGKGALSPVDLDMAIRERLHLRFDGKEALPKAAEVVGDNANDTLKWEATLPYSVKECEVLSRLYLEDRDSRTAVTIMRDDRVLQETLLDASHPDLLLRRNLERPVNVSIRYIQEGIGHIFCGSDHVLFILGLLLLGGSLKSLLKTVTAFTLAHCLTLTLAATNVWNPSPRIVEPLIALSIVAIAAENLRCLRNRSATEMESKNHASDESQSRPTPQIRDLRPYYAFGFGLIHGFGFAGALAEVGLPQASLGVALASFNIGVELGQAAIVLAVQPVLTGLLNSRPVVLRRLALTGSVSIGLAGAYWFFSRLGTS